MLPDPTLASARPDPRAGEDGEDLTLAEELAQGDGLYYVAQEAAFAPGISGVWPTVIKPPKMHHARLVKRDGAWAQRLVGRLRAAEAERDAHAVALQEINVYARTSYAEGAMRGSAYGGFRDFQRIVNLARRALARPRPGDPARTEEEERG